MRRTGEDGGYRGTLAFAGAQVARVASGEVGEPQLVDEQARIVPRASPRTVHATSAATVARCSSAIGFCGRYATRPGPRSTRPPLGCSSPAMVRSNVVFPPPLGPTRAITSPSCPAREIPSRMGVRAGPVATSLSSHAIVGAPCRSSPRPPAVDDAARTRSRAARRQRRPPSTAITRPSSEASWSRRCSATTTAVPSSASRSEDRNHGARGTILVEL